MGSCDVDLRESRLLCGIKLDLDASLRFAREVEWVYAKDTLWCIFDLNIHFGVS